MDRKIHCYNSGKNRIKMKFTDKVKLNIILFGSIALGLILGAVALFFAVWVFIFLVIILGLGLIAFYIWWYFFTRKVKKKMSRRVEVIEVQN